MRLEYNRTGDVRLRVRTGRGRRRAGDCACPDCATEFEVASDELPMQAAVAAVGQYASHEYERRRTRNVRSGGTTRRKQRSGGRRRRRSARCSATSRSPSRHGWCSDCMTKSDHRLVRFKNEVRHSKRYVCTACGSPTGWCDVPRCRNFADRGGGPDERARFCAEHSHEIPSFEKLDSSGCLARRLRALARVRAIQRSTVLHDRRGVDRRRRRRRTAGLHRRASDRWRDRRLRGSVRCGGHQPRTRASRRWERSRRAATGWRGEPQW